MQNKKETRKGANIIVPLLLFIMYIVLSMLYMTKYWENEPRITLIHKAGCTQRKKCVKNSSVMYS